MAFRIRLFAVTAVTLAMSFPATADPVMTFKWADQLSPSAPQPGFGRAKMFRQHGEIFGFYDPSARNFTPAAPNRLANAAPSTTYSGAVTVDVLSNHDASIEEYRTIDCTMSLSFGSLQKTGDTILLVVQHWVAAPPKRFPAGPAGVTQIHTFNKSYAYTTDDSNAEFRAQLYCLLPSRNSSQSVITEGMKLGEKDYKVDINVNF